MPCQLTNSSIERRCGSGKSTAGYPTGINATGISFSGNPNNAFTCAESNAPTQQLLKYCSTTANCAYATATNASCTLYCVSRTVPCSTALEVSAQKTNTTGASPTKACPWAAIPNPRRTPSSATT